MKSKGPRERAIESQPPTSSKAPTPEISLIILGYNGATLLPGCFQSILEQDFDLNSCEIVFADNASKDESAEVASRYKTKFPRMVIKQFQKNHGYARGINLSARMARGQILVFLNQDLILDPGFIRQIARTFHEYPTAGIVGCAVVDWEKERLVSGAVKILAGGFTYNYVNREGSCDAVSGAAFSIRRSSFFELGGFEESFFMYYEETDLCVRARTAGYQVLYNPRAVAYDLTNARERRYRDHVLFYMLRNRPIFSVMHSLNPHLTLLVDRLVFFPANVLLEFVRSPRLVRKNAIIRRAREESLSLCRQFVQSRRLGM